MKSSGLFYWLFYLVSHPMYHSCGVLPHRSDKIMVQMRSLWLIAARIGLCLHYVCQLFFSPSLVWVDLLLSVVARSE